jgi:hypothetical protein
VERFRAVPDGGDRPEFETAGAISGTAAGCVRTKLSLKKPRLQEEAGQIETESDAEPPRESPQQESLLFSSLFQHPHVFVGKTKRQFRLREIKDLARGRTVGLRAGLKVFDPRFK